MAATNPFTNSEVSAGLRSTVEVKDTGPESLTGIAIFCPPVSKPTHVLSNSLLTIWFSQEHFR
jgi:hypothetical protein